MTAGDTNVIVLVVQANPAPIVRLVHVRMQLRSGGTGVVDVVVVWMVTVLVGPNEIFT